MFNLGIDTGHMCGGTEYRGIHPILCSRCRAWNGIPSHGLPTILARCNKCKSENVNFQTGKCNKCNHVTEWLRTDRPYYNLKKDK